MKISFDTGAIGERLCTQDNRITQDPIFIVQEHRRTFGFDSDYSDNSTWVDSEGDEVGRAKAKKLDVLDAACRSVGNYRRVYFRDEWEYVATFFTEAAADHYIATQSHRHSYPLRTYAESLHRNPEMLAVRKMLMEQAVVKAEGAANGQ